mmetsp:Transcript_15170/g.20697  ORF Transcript_15170/g.20697 Transcript_15170/m.20697 type:complete len:249 (-) Transcript_15170:210-956(-)
MVKLSVLACALLASGASAYSVSRSQIRNLGQKSFAPSSGRKHTASMKMEDFGIMKGSGLGFEDLWDGEEAISEVGLEKRLNADGLRFKMNRTPEEADEVGPLLGLPGFTVNLPLIGETYLGPPKVSSIWEAIGFTATSNNDARQEEKRKAVEKARTAKIGVRGNEGATQRAKWLDKYGYPRLVGTNGIFYADQLSTDKKPSGGFNMGKSGKIWPIPEIVEEGNYGGEAGWGMKKKGQAIDGLSKADMP